MVRCTAREERRDRRLDVSWPITPRWRARCRSKTAATRPVDADRGRRASERLKIAAGDRRGAGGEPLAGERRSQRRAGRRLGLRRDDRARRASPTPAPSQVVSIGNQGSQASRLPNRTPRSGSDRAHVLCRRPHCAATRSSRAATEQFRRRASPSRRDSRKTTLPTIKSRATTTTCSCAPTIAPSSKRAERLRRAASARRRSGQQIYQSRHDAGAHRRADEARARQAAVRGRRVARRTRCDLKRSAITPTSSDADFDLPHGYATVRGPAFACRRKTSPAWCAARVSRPRAGLFSRRFLVGRRPPHRREARSDAASPILRRHPHRLAVRKRRRRRRRHAAAASAVGLALGARRALRRARAQRAAGVERRLAALRAARRLAASTNSSASPLRSHPKRSQGKQEAPACAEASSFYRRSVAIRS